MTCIVYIATSLDGFIADKNEGLDWLNSTPNPENSDLGFGQFMDTIDALVMGRKTFEMVCSFDCPWPYNKPVFVLSNSLKQIPDELQDKAELITGSPNEIKQKLKQRGFHNLYIDGGKTIQGFLKADLIDELTITTIPVLLGDGIPLFKELPEMQHYQHIKTEILLDALVKTSYHRKKI